MMQNNKKVIIVTGGIGTGKSTAVNILKEMGYKVLDSDRIVHEGYDEGGEIYEEVVKSFGNDIIEDDGTINRQQLGKIVFSDAKKLKHLNEIVHAYVFRKLIDGIRSCEDKVIFLDIPLAIEEIEHIKKSDIKYDEIWLIYVSREIQKDRLAQRAINENKNPDDVLKIIEKQISIEDKKSVADEVIINEGTVEELKYKLKKLLIKKDLI